MPCIGASSRLTKPSETAAVPQLVSCYDLCMCWLVMESCLKQMSDKLYQLTDQLAGPKTATIAMRAGFHSVVMVTTSSGLCCTKVRFQLFVEDTINKVAREGPCSLFFS